MHLEQPLSRRSILEYAALSGTVGLSVGDIDTESIDGERRFFDDFEWGGPLSDRYRPHRVGYEISSEAAFSAEYGVAGELDAMGWISSGPDDGLARYPHKGDELGAVFRVV